MDDPRLVWVLTIVGIVALLLFDSSSTCARLTPRSSARRDLVGVYVGIAVLFGAGVGFFGARHWAANTSPAT
jgi:tellurite resistance protein TerC